MGKQRKRTRSRRYPWGIEFTSETPARVPLFAKKGVVFNLLYTDKKVGQLKITGAGLHVRRAGKGFRWHSFYSFEKFLKKLID